MTIELMMKFLSRRRVETSRVGDQPDEGRAGGRPRLGHAATSAGVGAATAPRNSSTSVGSRQAKWSTRPVRSAAARTAWSSAPRVELEQGVAGLLGDHPDAGQRRRPAVRCLRDDDPQQPAGLAARAAPSTVPMATMRPRARMPTESHSRSTRSSWWLENTTGTPCRHCSSSASARESTPTGSRPENGSSRMQHLGAADEGGGELHPLLVAQRQLLDGVLAALGQTEPLGPLLGGVGGGGCVEPVQAGEVGELLADLHLRVEPALLRHVADPPPRVVVQRTAPPADLPGVGPHQAHGDPHRGRLAGPVGPAEAEHRPRRDGEAHAVQHVVVAVALVQPVELEHPSSVSSSPVRRYRHRVGSPSTAYGSRRTGRCGVIGDVSQNSIAQPPTGVGLDGLRAAAAGCRACELWEPATQTVFGEGPETARIVLVGEQPGDQEDLAGEPFVGPAGKLLDRALTDAGIDRRDAYVTNAVKHFRSVRVASAGSTRHHGPEHLRACRPWLEAEFEVLKPEVVVCLGATAAKALISPSFRITKDRGHLLPWTPPPARTPTRRTHRTRRGCSRRPTRRRSCAPPTRAGRRPTTPSSPT